MGDGSSPHDAALSDFKSVLRAYTMHSVCGRPYVLVTKLTEWMGSDSGSGTTQVERLLSAAYRYRDEPGLPPTKEYICGGDQSCLLVFSILIKIGWSDLVDRFRKKDIVDRRLPIDLLWLKRTIQEMELSDAHNAESIATEFEREQWSFCPAKFQLHLRADFETERIIPICRKEQINAKGTTANLWQIAIQEEFVEQRLREAVPSARYENRDDGLGVCYRFALKQFKEAYKDLFLNERSAVLALRHHKGMVRCLSEYTHCRTQSSGFPQYPHQAADQERGMSYNLLLEYGEYDLDEYFEAIWPPILQTKLEEFWNALFEVAGAVEGIHNLAVPTAGVIQYFYGWHADIKPDNILCVEGKFKLADPSFARFVKRTNEEQKIILRGGTETYGAPERHPGRTMVPVSRAIDIWSLGCVFSIAATWVVIGYWGIQQFEKVREKAIARLMKDQHSGNVQHSTRTPELNAGDYFHNTRDVLQEVLLWHDVLRSAARKTDTITCQVLDLVDSKMLQGRPENRIRAKELCEELARISRRCENNAPGMPIDPIIMDALIENDDGAP